MQQMIFTNHFSIFQINFFNAFFFLIFLHSTLLIYLFIYAPYVCYSPKFLVKNVVCVFMLYSNAISISSCLFFVVTSYLLYFLVVHMKIFDDSVIILSQKFFFCIYFLFLSDKTYLFCYCY